MATPQAMDEELAEHVDENEFILNHIILPRFLPQKKQNYSDQLRLVNQMLKHVIETRSHLPTNTIRLFQQLKKIHIDTTDDTLKDTLSKEIKSLQPDDTFAMFVRRQNCTLMIHKKPDGLILATFYGDAKPSDIYGHDSDLECHYPSNAIKVQDSRMLKSNHFIDQLCILYMNPPPENSNRNYVSNWLVPLLADPNSKTASTADIPMITKKLRNELVGDTNKGYFGRSRIYISTKVLLQHSLTKELGAELGKFLYKIVMLKFLSRVSVPYVVDDRATFNIELLSQMIAKMARRIEKLTSSQPNSMPPRISTLLNTTIEYSKHVIETIRQKIDMQIEKIHQNDEKRVIEPLKCLNFNSDVRHENLPVLKKYLDDRSSTTSNAADTFECEVKSYRRHFTNNWPKIETIADVNAKVETSNELGGVECRLFWNDFENRVLYSNDLNGKSAELLHQWALKYLKYSKKMYIENQLSTSRMVLVYLKMIATLDRQLCSDPSHQLFLKHQSGINLDIIDSLLLPQRKDVEIAGNIAEYFRGRNANASDPGLIEEKHASNDSFSVKFAKKNNSMKTLRKQILDQDEQNVEKKRLEWKERRQHIEMLRGQLNSMPPCRMIFGRKVCMPSTCERCKKIQEIDSIKIDVYEKLLPNEEHDQWAIVFELRTPRAIGCLRDMLYGFVDMFSGKSEKIAVKDWLERPGIRDFKLNAPGQKVRLGYTSQSTLKRNHVEQAFDKFVIANVSNCTFHADQKPMPQPITCEAIKNTPLFAPLKTTDEYSVLQWTMNGTAHTENEVLARQSKCPENLSLSEYKNFGTLRADGHRLLLRKLYAMIEMESLSFEKESVMSLIMQSLWECGIKGDTIERESHIDFLDQAFCTAMLERLTTYTTQQENNWMHPFKLLMVVVIAVRLYEINSNAPDNIVNQMIKLLHKIRSIVYIWIDKIDKVIHEMKTSDEECEQQLRLKLAYVAIIGCFTFFIHSEHPNFTSILRNNKFNGLSAAQQWLHFIITLKNILQVYTRKEKKLSSNLRMFLRVIERIGIDMEKPMKNRILADTKQIHDLIRTQWPKSNCAQFLAVNFHPEFTELLTVDIIEGGVQQKVSIDIITGTFQVNGLPLSRLPSYILDCDVYRWFFGDSAFEVQPDGHNSFSAIKKYNKCIYSFKKVNDEIIITERSDSGVERELIHHSKFKGDFPNLLEKSYSHWWDKERNCIEFQKRPSDQRHFSKETLIEYRLDLSSEHLIHEKTGRLMLDIKSASYQKLVNQLKRLEHPKYMHVLLEQENVVTIELFRMKLKFKLNYSATVTPDQEFKLVSNEFGGMHVSAIQNIGTLYGLNHGLILESTEQPSNSVQTKILLIPNGRVRTKYIADQQHVSVDIEARGASRNPLFYQYQVDESCQQLKSSDCSHASWFYLAYLHAVTSHGEIEPFLGMSGTERALQILQSAVAWSPSPYETESLDILREIVKLSPMRKLAEREHIQCVTWPRNIPSRSAQDSFVSIAKKLFDDCQRLHGLFSKEQPPDFTIKTDLRFNERDYHRCLQLQPNMRVGDTFIPPKELRTSLPESIDTSFSIKTQTISILYHTNQWKSPENPVFLRKFLTTKRKLLKGLQSDYEKTISQLLFHDECNDFANIWINLYNVARTKKCSDEEFALVLSLLAHQDRDLDPILALQAVARNCDNFKDIQPPKITEYNLNEGVYTTRKLSTQLRKHFTNKQITSSQVMDTIIDDLVAFVSENWNRLDSCPSVVFTNRFPQHKNDYNYASANEAINKKLASWHQRHQLDKFIDNVLDRLKTLPACSNLNVPKYDPFAIPVPKKWQKYHIDVEKKICNHLCDEHVARLTKQAHDIWTMKRSDTVQSATDWWSEIQSILHPIESAHLIQASLFPRIVPSLLLPKTIAADTDERLKALIGTWGLAIANEQHKRRIQMYSNRPDRQPAMEREIENKPHTNWMPCDRPEWLIFEIEQNLTIREIQIDVAKQMMNPPKQNGTDARHSVMQLNMGEGKTSVIIPMLAAALANGKQVCQITVLKALFTTNLKLLRQLLGGMLSQRVYTFPCRRDVTISKHIQSIKEIYEECQVNKGVILTQPDYRLSFQLKLYETLEKLDGDLIKQYLDTYRWINANVRNILDESDAILQPNYQLIYTMGKQSSPDGGEQRWMVIQALLKRVPYHMKRFHQKWKISNDSGHVTAPVEFDDMYVTNGSVHGAPLVTERADVFTPCRILDDDIFDELKSALADDFLDGKLDIVFSELDGPTKIELKKILIEKDISEQEFDSIRSLSTSEKNKIRILSGLLRFEVLKLALTKRWRVNYGVDAKGQRKMAIPFKAKDVPAEMSEFGHPDVAICLTQLSYYYSGLSDAQLHQLFMTLESKGNANGIYESWLTSKTAEVSSRLIDRSIRSYSGVNLDDPNQRDHILFPLLRHNMNAIDYYLSNVVYLSEAKIFEQKLMCTTWDLCSDDLQHCVTGFSGTNDTKTILPMPIAQNDLQKLENTNEEMRKILLKNQDPQHPSYANLPPNVSGMYIIKKMVEQNIPVLLDAGALMLELTNKEVAMKWLDLVPDTVYEAAIYFDARDILQTIDRNGTVTEFDCSVYRDNLSRCVVYLDDVHTRGTDLKFPLDWVACVTLSGDITRDKTVQSCMRMRRLGRNQKVCFWASYEADIRLRKVCNLTNADRVTNEHVIQFICQNSTQFESSNMVHWTTNALNYARKSIGHKLFEKHAADPTNTDPVMPYMKLYRMCLDRELVQLSDVYGDKEHQFLRNIAWTKFNCLTSEFKTNKEIRSFIRDIQDCVGDKLNEQASDVKQFTRTLNEEQQKEIEQEQESDEKRQAERSFGIKAAKPDFNEKFNAIVRDGISDADITEMTTSNKKLLHSFGESLSNTQLHQFCENNKNAWSSHLYVSRDFRTVIEGKSKNHDEYLRPVMWILQVKHVHIFKHILIVISSYECNRLLPAIRMSKKATLMMYQPRISQSHKNLLHDSRLHVTGQQQQAPSPNRIDFDDEVQIGMFAGSMYFESTDEQTAYCRFMGLIPQPWTAELKEAYEAGEIKSKGFVPRRCRRSLDIIFNCVGRCEFNDSPVDFATKLIEARHQSLQKESHVASILERGKIKLEDHQRFGLNIKMEVDDYRYLDESIQAQ